MATERRVKTLIIDGRDVAGREDQTILEAAREHGIWIPTLCHLEGLTNVGACRLCLVEVKGMGKLLSACTTTIWEGMEVTTHSERLHRYRRSIIELFLAERNHICAVCVANRRCQLQALALELGVDHVRYPYLYPRFGIDATHDLFVLDHNRCILCTRCIRACSEIEGANTLGMMRRGIHNRVITDLNQPWGESPTCTSCGKCVNVCPVGAISQKGLSVIEGRKEHKFLPYLTMMRGARP
ncbi:MAG: bidirectional hydrogenase complex protein HoxU [Desulfobacteraceae bacterium]|nr:bidirectional hydrogenase complex protein HoxU [Desulfobacteraceae bacterium]